MSTLENSQGRTSLGLLLQLFSEAERELKEEHEAANTTEEANTNEAANTTEAAVETKIEKCESPQKSSKFLNCDNQLVIRKDTFSHAYGHPSDNSQVCIYFFAGKNLQGFYINIVPGEASRVIQNIYDQLSE